jgi:predicted HTH transcriptional regulator
MTTEEFIDLIEQGHESPAVEFKPGAPRTAQAVFARIARAVLALSNRRDGGWVIIGVEEKGGKTPILKGVEAADLAGWNHDDVSAALNGFADPYVSVDVEVVAYNNSNFVVIRVHEFEEVPVICRRDVPAPPGEKRPILRDGACYVRSRKKPESVEMPTQTEMRELLELAVDKGVRKFLRRAESVSIASRPTDKEQYDGELSDLR